MFVLRGTNLIIRLEMDIYFLIELLCQGEALRYPLPAGRVNLDRFQSGIAVVRLLLRGASTLHQ